MSTISTTHDHAHDHPHGWRRWLFATNHKDIGTMYLIFAFVSLLAGGVMALGIRLELFQPGLQYLRPEFFNQLTTMHGLVMVFGAIMPAFVGFANWMIPLQIGASVWLIPSARRRAVRRLDLICTIDLANGARNGYGHLRIAPFRRFFDYGFD
jgi:hypothetical protein